jgi:hypothetical protein
MTTLLVPVRVVRACACAVVLLLVAPPKLAQFPYAGPTALIANLRPEGIAYADFNRDGWTDLAVATEAPDRITLFFGQGSGSFASPSFIALPGGSAPAGLVAFDCDLDQDADLAVALEGLSSVRVALNQLSQGGSFTLGGPLGVGSQPRALAAADLDEDGLPDLVSSNHAGNSVSVLLNQGAGNFASSGSFAVGQQPRGLVLAELSGDARPEIAVACFETRNVHVLHNQGSGGFGPLGVLSVGASMRPDGLAALDCNGDGALDLAVATQSTAPGSSAGSASVFLRAGQGFSPLTSYPLGANGAGDLAARDLDLDGELDLAVLAPLAAQVALVLGIGDGTFGSAQLLPVGAGPKRVLLADLDVTGSPDVLVSSADTHTLTLYPSSEQSCGFSSYGSNLPAHVLELSGSGATASGGAIALTTTGLVAGPCFTGLAIATLELPILGGLALVDLSFASFLFARPVVAGTSVLELGIPWNAPNFVYRFQSLALDPAQAQGFAFSAGLELRLCDE